MPVTGLPARKPTLPAGCDIATSLFYSAAKEEADRINARIELIGGQHLAQLLVAYGVGVDAAPTVTLHRVDEDFFEDPP